MSTGANCRLVERKPGQWYYELQRWPYGDNPSYDEEGPFGTYQAAAAHLRGHHANPGGYSIQALPGCKHDLTRKLDYNPGGGETHACDRCGKFLRLERKA